MNRRLLAVLIFAAPLVAIGCAVQGLPFEKVPPAADHAVIYVYRPYNYAGSLLRPSVTCGEDTARIGPGGYHAFIVPTGQVVCSVQTETADAVEINAEPHAYYIKEEIGWGVLTGHPHLNPIDNDKGQSEIQSCCVREP
jgi:hypothetical protein